MREVDLLAHELALESAVGGINCAAMQVSEGDGVEWLEVDPVDLDPYDNDVRYLELRGAIVRHPSRKNWLRLVQPGAVE
ncbi:MAG TPA: hypothetical protein VFW25_12495 [Silvibacterium sp.]|nr:hypothetical protein [Silvibacterium sp.]